MTATKRHYQEPTSHETLLMMALLVIARSKPECQGCDWESPCNQCFAATTVANTLSNPKFKKWRKHYKIVAKKKKKVKSKCQQSTNDAAMADMKRLAEESV